jgi:hypothetical protein
MRVKQQFLAAVVCVLMGHSAMGQTEELKTFEVAPVFTSITKPNFGGGKTEAGLGGRITFNLNPNVALEAEGNFFPGNCQACVDENTGNLTQGFFGVKAGKRFRSFGLFAKARPGFASFSEGEFNTTVIATPPGQFPILLIDRNRKTNFAFDLGGVLELYHSKRIFTRFDAGDTIIHYGAHTFNGLTFDPATGSVTVIPISRQGDTRHNFQFSASVGFRF